MSRLRTDPPARHPISGLRLKASTCILLVRAHPDEEARCLAALDDLTARVLRVRHPLPACQRIRVVRPTVVVVGRGVRDEDARLLIDAAREAGSEVVELGAFVAPWALEEVLRRAVARATRSAKAKAKAADR
jgi:hypothetical protein